MSVRLVLLTDGNSHGVGILQGCRVRRVEFSAVAFEGAGSLWDCVSEPTFFPVRVAKALVHWCRRRAWQQTRIKTFRREHNHVAFIGLLGSARFLENLRRLEPDFLVLGGIGILNRDELAVAKHGVLNAHPGLLPWARGMDVVGHSILRGVPVGATCHFVNTGIDCGHILMRRATSLAQVPRELAAITAATDRLATDMMVDLITGPVIRGDELNGFPQNHRYPLCQQMTQEERERAEAAARAENAHVVEQRWRANKALSQDGSLPNDLAEDFMP